MLGRFKKLEERDTTQSNYSRRPSHFGFTSLMLFSNFAIIVIDFHMTRKAWGLTHGRWFHLKMLGFIEMMAGYAHVLPFLCDTRLILSRSVTCISVVLYGLKMRRVRRQGDEESEVLAALDEYADDPEEV